MRFDYRYFGRNLCPFYQECKSSQEDLRKDECDSCCSLDYYRGGKSMTQSFFESEIVTFLLLCLAVFRIYLQVIGFNFQKLPITSRMAHSQKFHRYGLYFSLGYFVLFAPGYLLS